VERRGKPTVWKKFGEANAILAGDALQALAFRTAAHAPRNVDRILAALAAAGVGVVQGQVEDLALERGTDGASGAPAALPAECVDFIYTHKTADLFVAAAALGATAGGGTDAQVAQLRDFARHLGLAFQHEDDLLDGDSPLGRAEAERLVREHTDAALAALADLPGDTSFLASLAARLATRKA
jgi:geranylgeranyl pyrophosphate synthase